jgi:hypothetical protein
MAKPEGERKIGPEEKLWKTILDRAEMSEENQAPLLGLARGRDLDIGRIQRGQQKIVEVLDRLAKALESTGNI